MIVTLSGITGTGKSFFKNIIVQELGFENLVIVTTRERRENETNGIDKTFVTNDEFNKLKQEGKLSVDFEFLGARYAYKKDNLNSARNQVTEVHYSTIYEFKKNVKDIFSIYMFPTDFERAKIELQKRHLPREIEEKRIQEMKEQIEEFSKNKELQQQFDYVFINDYTENSKEKLLKNIKNKLNRKGEILI